MAWTTPRTWVTGEVVTAAMLNEQIRDNELFLRKHVGAYAYKTANQSIANNAGDGFTALTFNAELYDTDTLHDNAANTSRFTIPAGLDGYWVSMVQVDYAASAVGGRREAELRKNGVTHIARVRIPPGSVQVRVQCVAVVNMVAGDYIEGGANQDSGAALNALGGDSEQTHLQIGYMGQ